MNTASGHNDEGKKSPGGFIENEGEPQNYPTNSIGLEEPFHIDELKALQDGNGDWVTDWENMFNLIDNNREQKAIGTNEQFENQCEEAVVINDLNGHQSKDEQTFTNVLVVNGSSYELTTHDQNQQDRVQDIKNYLCEICGLCYRGSDGLYRHYDTKHSDDPTPYFCPICEKHFTRSESVKRHIKRFHSKKRCGAKK